MFKGHAARGVAFAFVVTDRRAPVSAPLGVPPRRPRGCQGATCKGQVGLKPSCGCGARARNLKASRTLIARGTQPPFWSPKSVVPAAGTKAVVAVPNSAAMDISQQRRYLPEYRSFQTSTTSRRKTSHGDRAGRRALRDQDER